MSTAFVHVSPLTRIMPLQVASATDSQERFNGRKLWPAYAKWLRPVGPSAPVAAAIISGDGGDGGRDRSGGERAAKEEGASHVHQLPAGFQRSVYYMPTAVPQEVGGSNMLEGAVPVTAAHQQKMALMQPGRLVQQQG